MPLNISFSKKAMLGVKNSKPRKLSLPYNHVDSIMYIERK